MSTGRKIHLKGFKLDKYGKRVARDPNRLNVSARLKEQGRQKMTWRRRGK